MNVVFFEQEHLSNRHFAMMLFAALVLHLSILTVWMLVPRERPNYIPVRILNIKFGEEDIPESELISPLQQPDTTDPVAAIDQALNPQKKSVERIVQKLKPFIAPPAPSDVLPLKPQPAQEQPQQFVRMAPITAGQQGNSMQSEDVQRYGQVLGLWVRKFRPSAETLKFLQLPPVTSQVRIRLDRRGNLRAAPWITTTSGNAAVDKLALETVGKANPFPAAPPDYEPGATLFEFTIPVFFENDEPKPSQP